MTPYFPALRPAASLESEAASSSMATTRASDRMPPLQPSQMTPAQQEAAAEIAAGRRGRVDGPFVPALRSPELTRRLQRLGEYLRYDHALEPRLRELVILLTAREWTQDYEWFIHEPIARAAGLSAAVIDAVADGRRPDDMAADEALIWNFVHELLRTRSVADATYAHAVSMFGEQGVIDLVAAVGYYSTLAMIMNVARTPLPAGADPVLRRLPL
jgi:4-carboxymuconolactone decarboxylase